MRPIDGYRALVVRGDQPPQRPPGMTPREFEAFQLYVLAEAGVTRVRLWAPSTPGTPPECTAADGTELSVDEAMRDAPIPHGVGPGRRCRCAYRPAG